MSCSCIKLSLVLFTSRHHITISVSHQLSVPQILSNIPFYLFQHPSTFTQIVTMPQIMIDVTDFRGLLSEEDYKKKQKGRNDKRAGPPLDWRSPDARYPLHKAEGLKEDGRVSYLRREEHQSSGYLRTQLQNLCREVFPNPLLIYLDCKYTETSYTLGWTDWIRSPNSCQDGDHPANQGSRVGMRQASIQHR